MSGQGPRKFSEKIAIMERKQNEDQSNFEEVMRSVKNITSTVASPTVPIQTTGSLHPPQWNQLGGSLPNVHQMPSYHQQWQQWPEQNMIPQHRSRSPENVHYHPYMMRGNQKGMDRVPPLHPHYPSYPPQQPHQMLQPPEWNQMNRARSDTAIHQAPQHMPMHPLIQQQHYMHQMPMQAGPSGMMMTMHPGHVPPPNTSQGMGGMTPQSSINISPLQSPMSNMNLGYSYPGGSPLQSPLNSPVGSTMMLDENRTATPLMELSPPGPDPMQENGSLPNLQQLPAHGGYHATVGPRHSTGHCGQRLVPGPALTPESQSAPTSPHNTLDPQQPQWRNFSNSPESMDIPRVVLTNPDGAHGQHLECFDDLQHLDQNDIGLLSNGDEGSRHGGGAGSGGSGGGNNSNNPVPYITHQSFPEQQTPNGVGIYNS